MMSSHIFCWFESNERSKGNGQRQTLIWHTGRGRKEGKEKVHWQNVKCQAANVSKWQVKQRTGNQPKPVTCRHVIYVQEQWAAKQKVRGISRCSLEQLEEQSIRDGDHNYLDVFAEWQAWNNNEQLVIDTHHISESNTLCSNLFQNYISYRKCSVETSARLLVVNVITHTHSLPGETKLYWKCCIHTGATRSAQC